MRLLLLFLILCLTACTPTVHYGDAAVRQTSPLFSVGEPIDDLRLPGLPADQPGRQVFHVRDLPLGLYPTQVELLRTFADARGKGTEVEPHWQLPVRVTLRTVDGKQLDSWQAAPGSHQVPATVPRLRSYDVELGLTAGTGHPGDRLVLYTNWLHRSPELTDPWYGR